MSIPDPAIRIAKAVRQVVLDHARDDWPTRDVYRHVVALAEKPLIEETLRLNAGNESRTAHALGINRNTLRRKIRQHEIKR